MASSPIPDLGPSVGESTDGGSRISTVECHMLDRGQRDVAVLVDAFCSTYNAAYR
jgi:hypothetical protein